MWANNKNRSTAFQNTACVKPAPCPDIQMNLLFQAHFCEHRQKIRFVFPPCQPAPLPFIGVWVCVRALVYISRHPHKYTISTAILRDICSDSKNRSLQAMNFHHHCIVFTGSFARKYWIVHVKWCAGLFWSCESKQTNSILNKSYRFFRKVRRFISLGFCLFNFTCDPMVCLARGYV